MSAKVVYAKSVLADKIFHINDITIGSKEEFICCECKTKLVPVKTEKRGKDWHFRHPVDAETNKCRSTALHDFAIQILMNNTSIVLSKHLKITYSTIGKEVWVNKDYRSDVKIQFEETNELHFEVVVTHDMEQRKKDFYETEKIKCCRLDLSDKALLTATPEFITDLVINEYNNKSILGWQIEPPKEWYEHPLFIIPVVTAVFIALGSIFSSLKPKRKRR